MLLLFSWERIGRPVTFETHIWKDRSTYAQGGGSKARTLTPGSQANVLVTRAPGRCSQLGMGCWQGLCVPGQDRPFHDMLAATCRQPTGKTH